MRIGPSGEATRVAAPLPTSLANSSVRPALGPTGSADPWTLGPGPPQAPTGAGLAASPASVDRPVEGEVQ